MQELEYILVTDLQRTRNARIILRDICPEVNNCIDGSDYRSLMVILCKWETDIDIKIDK